MREFDAEMESNLPSGENSIAVTRLRIFPKRCVIRIDFGSNKATSPASEATAICVRSGENANSWQGKPTDFHVLAGASQLSKVTIPPSSSGTATEPLDENTTRAA